MSSNLAEANLLVLLYRRVGQRIATELLGEGRGAYGKEIVVTLSQQSEPSYGRGFDMAGGEGS